MDVAEVLRQELLGFRAQMKPLLVGLVIGQTLVGGWYHGRIVPFPNVAAQS